jgi:hypothetical protein
MIIEWWGMVGPTDHRRRFGDCWLCLGQYTWGADAMATYDQHLTGWKKTTEVRKERRDSVSRSTITGTVSPAYRRTACRRPRGSGAS